MPVFLNVLGYVLNIAGTLCAAWAFGPIPDGGYTEDDAGRKYEFTYFKNPKAFRWGLYCLVAGNFIQLIGYVTATL